MNRELLISLMLKGCEAVGHELEEDMDSRKGVLKMGDSSAC